MLKNVARAIFAFKSKRINVLLCAQTKKKKHKHKNTVKNVPKFLLITKSENMCLVATCGMCLHKVHK